MSHSYNSNFVHKANNVIRVFIVHQEKDVDTPEDVSNIFQKDSVFSSPAQK